jgi:recombinational DNA repair protein RecR
MKSGVIGWVEKRINRVIDAVLGIKDGKIYCRFCGNHATFNPHCEFCNSDL